MKKRILLITLIGFNFAIKGQTFSSLTSNGSNKKIEWTTSDWGKGFGHKIYSLDPGGKTLLNIAARHNNTSWTDLMTFTSNGNVGIGTTNPQSKLHIRQSVDGETGGFTLQDTGTRLMRIYGEGASGRQVFATHGTTNPLAIDLNGIERMRINSKGNVGIGTTNPTEKLSVNGKISSNGIKMSGSNKKIEWTTSDWGKGFGHKIYSLDPGGKTLLNIAARHNNSGWTDLMTFTSNGNVGIGTTNPTEKLTIDGKILCEEVEVVADITAPDYVFQKYYTGTSKLKEDYTMPTLEEVEAFTKANHHLPEVPSAKDMKEEGMQLKEMTTILLQKVEELTLYTIEQEKRIKALEAELKSKKI